MNPIYQERGSVKLGYNFFLSANASWPLGKIEVYDDRVVLKALFFKSVVKILDIDSVSKYMLGGLKINHHGRNVPYIVYFSKNKEKLVEVLLMLGVRVS